MPRYIDADKLPELFGIEYKKTRRLIEGGEDQLDNLAEGFTEATRVIRFVAKPEDVAPVVHAHWIEKRAGSYGRWQSWCSACGEHSGIGGIESNRHKAYCPNCGARMDEEEDEPHGTDIQ